MRKLNKVSTWLPGFSGFYGSLWEDTEDMEIEGINDERKEKGLSPITYDDCEWDYKTFHNDLSEKICSVVCEYLKDNGFIQGYKYEKLTSPREYNFYNDSVNVTMISDMKATKRVIEYLIANKLDFEKYLKNKYTSYDGFCSSYPNDIDAWLGDIGATLAHYHMLGSVLDFILRHHLKIEENESNIDGWLYEATNDYNYIRADNYNELINPTEVKLK